MILVRNKFQRTIRSHIKNKKKLETKFKCEKSKNSYLAQYKQPKL